jgi:hypothetical protein
MPKKSANATAKREIVRRIRSLLAQRDAVAQTAEHEA